ncbi:MAG: hypothetical protein VXY84_00365 [Pseudomonadota bacterium]|nr:hypothetical protein [Pseudomonadota bacterium]MEC8452384.1 hypothetical protein [Pseudomonadota bacterium]
MRNSNFPKAQIIRVNGGNANKRQMMIMKSCFKIMIPVWSGFFTDHDL